MRVSIYRVLEETKLNKIITLEFYKNQIKIYVVIKFGVTQNTTFLKELLQDSELSSKYILYTMYWI